MNLDTLSYGDEIQQAVKRVRLSKKNGSWALLGYVDKVKKSTIMTVNVKEEGNVWTDLLDSFEDNRMQYAYVKLDLEAKGNMKLFLIQWIGKDVDENIKLSCTTHLTEFRNLLNPYDSLITAMDPTDVQAKIHNFLCRNETASSQTSSSIKVSSQGKLPNVKVIIIGNSAVGKTYIYNSYVKGGIDLSEVNLFEGTIGIEVMSKTVRLGKHKFTLNMWDTAGEERFDALMPSWLRNAQVVICVYDITNERSYQAIPKHVLTAKQYTDPRAIFFLLGNKADLANRREVQEADGEKLATQHGMTFMECSGITGLNISSLFESIASKVVLEFEDILTSSDPSLPNNPTIQLNNSNRDHRPPETKWSCFGVWLPF